MRWLPQDRGIPIAAAVSFGMTFACAWWVTPAPLLLLLPVLSYMASDSLAGWRRRDFCVYMLRSEGGEALYVGSTNDVERRALEHTSPAHHEPWRVRIHSITVLRWCHSARQAERVERRRIRALAVAAENGWCRPLHNETWSAPARYPRKVWHLGWSWVYLCQSCLWAHTCWHREPQQSWAYVIPRRPFDDEWSNDDWEPSPRQQERQQAVINRHALPPAPVSTMEPPHYVGGPDEPMTLTPDPDDEPPTDPPATESGHHESAASHAEKAARRRAQNRQAAKAYRERRKGKGS